MDPASKVVMEMMEQGQGQGQMEAEGLHNRGPKPTQVQGQGQGQGRGQKADERSSVIFFDAIHPSFSPQVFLQQFMAHFCPPLVFCWGCPANQGYHYTSSLFYLIFNWGHPLCIILMLVSFAFSGTAGLSGAFLMPLVFFSQHKAQVAVKYASLSPTEWARFMSAPRHLSTIYMYQMQLFSSWFSMDEIVMQFEIGASSSRLGARVQKMHLIVADPQTPDTISQFRLWNALLRGQRYVDAGAGTAMELVRRADGHYQLTVTDLCAALIRQGSDRREEEETVNLIVAFFTYTNLAIPIATMLMHCCDHPNTQQICFLLLFLTSSTILNYTYGSLFLRLLYIAVVDVERQGHVMRTLDCLLRLNDFHIQDAQRESFEESEQIVQRRVDDIMRIGSGNNAMHVYCPLARRGCTQNGNEDRDRERDWERDREQAGRRQSRASMGGMGAGGGVGMGETLSSLHANQALPQANASTPSARAATAVPFPTAPTTAINNSGIGNSGAYVCDIGTEVDTGCETDTDRLPAGLRRRPRTSLQSELMVADHDLAVPPRLSMDWQENIMGWLHARLVLQGFGLRWRERIDMYVALNVALVLLFMAGVLAVLASTQDRTAIITSPFFLQLMLVVTTCVGFLLVFSKKAAECNNVMETHSASLGSHLLHLRERSESLRQEAAGLRYQQLHAKMKRDRQRGQGQGLRERVEAAQKGADGAGAGKGERVWTEAELEEAGAELLLKVEEELETTRSVIETLEGGVDIADRATATHPYLMFQLQAADSLTMSIATTAFSFYSVLATLLFSAEDSVLNTYAEVR